VAVRCGSDPIQALLGAQFDARPFAFISVEGSSVHLGEVTVARVL